MSATTSTAIIETTRAGANGPPGRAAPAAPAMEAVERVLMQGDLSRLTADERLLYYRQVCDSLGLNPLTQPFEYLNFNGKLRLYPTKDCAAQLRRLHEVSLEIIAQETVADVLLVRVRATLPGGKGRHRRVDEDEGAVAVAGLKGEALANAVLKCVTKAKRRATLSVCGLGFLDGPDEEAGGQAQQRAVAPEPGSAPGPAALPAPAPAPTPEQLDELRRLKAALGIDQAAWSQILQRRGVASARALSSDQAVDLTVRLKERELAQKAALLPPPAAVDLAPSFSPGEVASDDAPF